MDQLQDHKGQRLFLECFYYEGDLIGHAPGFSIFFAWGGESNEGIMGKPWKKNGVAGPIA